MELQADVEFESGAIQFPFSAVQVINENKSGQIGDIAGDRGSLAST